MATYTTSSQLRHWTFKSNQPIIDMQTSVNADYINKQIHRFTNVEPSSLFLSVNDENTLKRHFEFVMKSFCNEFVPPMPPYVFATSMAYFKRYYLKDSVMNYHPEDIMYTCVFLACKIDEFNVSISQFVKNIHRPHLSFEEITDVILSQELHLMSKLNYDLTIHSPFRATQGFILDIKTQFLKIKENLIPPAYDFLQRCLFTDIMFLYSPSQIALSALFFAAKFYNIDITRYITENLCNELQKPEVNSILQIISDINNLLKNERVIVRSDVKKLLKEIEICRNPKHDYKSQIYKELQEQEAIRIEKELISEMNFDM